MTKLTAIFLLLALALGIPLGLCGSAGAHSGMVDGYGCHLGRDKVSYHCHEGEFAGRTFKSKTEFLRALRGGKSTELSPKSDPLSPEKKVDR